jgi:hypothetical protein
MQALVLLEQHLVAMFKQQHLEKLQILLELQIMLGAGSYEKKKFWQQWIYWYR